MIWTNGLLGANVVIHRYSHKYIAQVNIRVMNFNTSIVSMIQMGSAQYSLSFPTPLTVTQVTFDGLGFRTEHTIRKCS
jgi:hypothetical protein